jgi:hypothetical protein
LKSLITIDISDCTNTIHALLSVPHLLLSSTTDCGGGHPLHDQLEIIIEGKRTESTFALGINLPLEKKANAKCKSLKRR